MNLLAPLLTRALPALLAALASARPADARDAPAAPEREAAVVVELAEGPTGGTLRLLLFDAAVDFGRFSDPTRVVEVPADGRTRVVARGLEPGVWAAVVHHDEDGDGEFAKNFLGIPREPIAISRGYRPKGPPVFARASFALGPGAERVEELELFRVLGDRGLIGLGVGVVGRGSPYVGDGSGVLQPIPAITYNGERLQWFGPRAAFGLVGSDRLRLAATAQYRLRAYEEDDSDALRGLGDRKDTLMAGLAVQAELPAGFGLSVGYEHDVLDRIGGGSARAELSRSFQLGIARFSPTAALQWSSASLADHDYGVPASAAVPGRPAYDVGDALVPELGVGLFLELSRSWRVVADVSVELLPGAVTNSPIVERDAVLKGFLALNYVL